MAPLCALSFAPTGSNLLEEHRARASIVVTGNTVIDALLWVRERVNAADGVRWRDLLGPALHARVSEPKRKLVLITDRCAYDAMAPRDQSVRRRPGVAAHRACARAALLR